MKASPHCLRIVCGDASIGWFSLAYKHKKHTQMRKEHVQTVQLGTGIFISKRCHFTVFYWPWYVAYVYIMLYVVVQAGLPGHTVQHGE